MGEMLPMDFVRPRFPGLETDWALFDNAGGAQVVDAVVERVRDYLLHANVQLGASYGVSREADRRVDEGRRAAARLFGTDDPTQVVLGPSSTALTDRLARSMVGRLLHPGDEVVVTDVDHETNIGAWRRLTAAGIMVKTWRLDPETLTLRLEDLEPLMTPRTRLAAFTCCSNVVGTIHPVAEIVRFLHDRGALAVVDAVAYAPHRALDVAASGVDFLFFSFYKVFGPHVAALYGQRRHLLRLSVLNHFFYGEQDLPGKLEPGGPVPYELVAALPAIPEYLDELERRTGGAPFDAVAAHEEALAERLLSFLRGRPGVRIVGHPEADRRVRVSTISFVSDRVPSEDVTLAVDRHRVGIRFGHFYARRLIDALGLDPHHGVVRASMVHYNTAEEVDRLVAALDEVL